MRRSSVVVALLTAAVLLFGSLVSAQDVTLVVWDQWYRGAENEVIEQLNREFEQNNPGVTINRTRRPLDDLKATLGLALSSGQGPAVANVNQGAADMGAMSMAGLLLPLDQHAEKLGWTERFSAGLLDRNRWTDDGDFGTGALYGLSPQAEVVGVFYNKDIFAAVGATVPETFEEFEALLATLKSHGHTPIAFGLLEGWPGIHTYGAIQHVLLDERGGLDDLIYGRGGSFRTEANLKAAEIFADWSRSGYFTDGFLGIGYDDSWQLFAAGHGAMMITGSWLAGELVDQTNIGFFLMPPVAGSGNTAPLSVGGTGIALSVTSNADAAAAEVGARYIDWMMSHRAAELWVEHGFLPAMPVDAHFIEEDTLLGDILDAWERLNAADAVGHYLDWASPSMYDTFTASIQELADGRITPAQFLSALDADYQAYLANR